MDMKGTLSALEHAQEINSLASLLISRFGVRAAAYASHQALKARRCGEMRRMEAWRLIADATAEVWRREPEATREEMLA